MEQKNTLMGLADEARLHNDPALAKSLQEECDQINARLRKTLGEMKAEVSLSDIWRKISRVELLIVLPGVLIE